MTTLIKTPAEKEQEAKFNQHLAEKKQEEAFKEFRKNRKLETELMQEELNWYNVLLELKEAKTEYHTEEKEAQKMVKAVIDDLIDTFKLDSIKDDIYKHTGFAVATRDAADAAKTIKTE